MPTGGGDGGAAAAAGRVPGAAAQPSGASRHVQQVGLDRMLLWTWGGPQYIVACLANSLSQTTNACCVLSSVDMTWPAHHPGRCRAETAVAGRVCRHCKLEERFWQWEVGERKGEHAMG